MQGPASPNIRKNPHCGIRKQVEVILYGVILYKKHRKPSIEKWRAF